MIPGNAEPAERKSVLWWTMLVSVLWGFGALLAALIAVMTVFMFDAPGSGGSIITLLLAGGFWVLPFVLLVSCLGGIVYSRGVRNAKRNKRAVQFVALPLLNLVFIGIMWGLLMLVCSGSFVCHA